MAYLKAEDHSSSIFFPISFIPGMLFKRMPTTSIPKRGGSFKGIIANPASSAVMKRTQREKMLPPGRAVAPKMEMREPNTRSTISKNVSHFPN